MLNILLGIGMLNPVGFPLALPGCAQSIDVQKLVGLATPAKKNVSWAVLGGHLRCFWAESRGALRLRLLLQGVTFFCSVRPHCQLVSCCCVLIMGQDWADMAVVVVAKYYH